MEDESYSGLSSNHLLGSVPAVVDDSKKINNYVGVTPEAIPQVTPPASSGMDGGRGYQSPGGPSDGGGEPTTTNWQGIFNIASYTQYFNVDTDVVMNRLICSLNPTSGDFFSKIDANPDLYGLIWVSTTLVFVIAAFGNVGTYFTEKVSDSSYSWSFNVNYVNIAVAIIYGYAVVLPLAFYFLIKYLGSNASPVRFWCMWGYSLFVFVPCSMAYDTRSERRISLLCGLQPKVLYRRQPSHLSSGGCICLAVCVGTLHQDLVLPLRVRTLPISGQEQPESARFEPEYGIRLDPRLLMFCEWRGGRSYLIGDAF